MTNGEIARKFVQKGWEIRYRGGNSRCATPSSLDMIVAETPKASRDRSTPWLAAPSRYSIAAYTWRPNLSESQEPILELYDAKREVTVGVRRVPTPERAAELLGRYGVPESEVDSHKPMMVPQSAECSAQRELRLWWRLSA